MLLLPEPDAVTGLPPAPDAAAAEPAPVGGRCAAAARPRLRRCARCWPSRSRRHSRYARSWPRVVSSTGRKKAAQNWSTDSTARRGGGGWRSVCGVGQCEGRSCLPSTARMHCEQVQGCGRVEREWQAACVCSTPPAHMQHGARTAEQQAATALCIAAAPPQAQHSAAQTCPAAHRTRSVEKGNLRPALQPPAAAPAVPLQAAGSSTREP